MQWLEVSQTNVPQSYFHIARSLLTFPTPDSGESPPFKTLSAEVTLNAADEFLHFRIPSDVSLTHQSLQLAMVVIHALLSSKVSAKPSEKRL